MFLDSTSIFLRVVFHIFELTMTPYKFHLGYFGRRSNSLSRPNVGFTRFVVFCLSFRITKLISLFWVLRYIRLSRTDIYVPIVIRVYMYSIFINGVVRLYPLSRQARDPDHSFIGTSRCHISFIESLIWEQVLWQNWPHWIYTPTCQRDSSPYRIFLCTSILWNYFRMSLLTVKPSSLNTNYIFRPMLSWARYTRTQSFHFL